MQILVLPFIVLNMFAGLVGGIWLATLGEWSNIVLGLVMTFGGSFLISIALLPSMLLLAPLAGLSAITKKDPSPIAFAFFAMLGVGYIYCVMGAWVHLVLFTFIPSGDAAAKIPLLLWSYATATSIWNYMAQQDSRSNPNSYAGMSAFFNQIGVLSAIFYAWGVYPRIRIWDITWWWAVPMGLCLVLQIWMVLAEQHQRQRYYGG